MAIKLGNGGGRGIIIGREKMVIIKPNPPPSIAIIKSLIEILSPEVFLTTSAKISVAIILFSAGFVITIVFYLDFDRQFFWFLHSHL